MTDSLLLNLQSLARIGALLDRATFHYWSSVAALMISAGYLIACSYRWNRARLAEQRARQAERRAWDREQKALEAEEKARVVERHYRALVADGRGPSPACGCDFHADQEHFNSMKAIPLIRALSGDEANEREADHWNQC
jgi:hypothetical protein